MKIFVVILILLQTLLGGNQLTIAAVDNTTLLNLTPNLDIGDVADPALRLAAFQYIYTEMQAIINEVNSLPTSNLQDLSVTTAKINNLAIITGKIADLAVTTAKLNDLSVTLAKMATNSVGSSQIVNASVTTPKLADQSVTFSKLDPALVTADISLNIHRLMSVIDHPDGSVTDAKLSNNPTAIKTRVATLQTDSVNDVNNWLKGKTINFMGDSLTYGSDPATGLQLARPYPTIVGNILQSTINNYGIGGNRLTGTGGMAQRVLTMDLSASVNVIQGGANDWSNQVPLGKITDTGVATVYGALNTLCTNIISLFPNSINYFILSTKNSATPAVPSTLYSLDALNDAVMDIAKKYNFLAVDMYYDAPNMAPANATLKTRWAPDGVHYNQAYLDQFYGPKVARYLLSKASNYTAKNTSPNDLGDYKISAAMAVTGAIAFVPLTGIVENISSKSVTLSSDTLVIQEDGIYDIDFSAQTLANWSGTMSIGILVNGTFLASASNTFVSASVNGACNLKASRKVKLLVNDVITFNVLSSTSTSISNNAGATWIQIKKV